MLFQKPPDVEVLEQALLGWNEDADYRTDYDEVIDGLEGFASEGEQADPLNVMTPDQMVEGGMEAAMQDQFSQLKANSEEYQNAQQGRQVRGTAGGRIPISRGGLV